MSLNVEIMCSELLEIVNKILFKYLKPLRKISVSNKICEKLFVYSNWWGKRNENRWIYFFVILELHSILDVVVYLSITDAFAIQMHELN